MKRTLVLGLALLCATAPLGAQDANFLMPIDSIEAFLLNARLEILRTTGARAPGDRTLFTSLAHETSGVVNVKLAKAFPGASSFNNEPRYELAAYELQKLFLGPDEYVVPPTVLRMVPTDWLREYDAGASATFRDTGSTLILLQYWLSQVTDEDVWDRDRLKTDSLYARHIGNLNILTYLIRHSDANEGNFLISQHAANPRVFSVDNGVAFRSQASDRGNEWRRFRVDRLPHATVDRLRAITPGQIEALGTLVQFELRGSLYQPVPIGPNLDEKDGVREKDGVVQLGLTDREIREVLSRLGDLLKDIDDGKFEVF